MFVVSLLPCEHFLHMDRIVISSRAPSSPSPRAHKSSRSAVTSARPRGPGWHSVSHYILVSRRSDTTPPLCSTFLLRSFCSIIYAQKNLTKRQEVTCFIGLVEPQSCHAVWVFTWKQSFKWLLYLLAALKAPLTKWLLVQLKSWLK